MNPRNVRGIRHKGGAIVRTRLVFADSEFAKCAKLARESGAKAQ